MPRRRKDCPICGKRNLAKLSNHLADIYQISGETRRYYLSNAKSIGNQSESEEMSSRKRMRNESDEETLTVSNEDIFSSSEEEDGKSSEDIDDFDESESYEEMNESDESEEADPWGVLIHHAASELRTKYDELVQNFQNEGLSKIEAKKKAFSEILPVLRKELGNVYLDRLQWMTEMKRDPVHRKIMKTRDALIHEDHFDPDEALAAAIKKRKFLLERMLEDRQHFPENYDNDEDVNAYEPYELKNEFYHH